MWVVVVTGASAGIGRATVRQFAAKGASIGLVARGREGLEEARREVEDLGGRALVLPCDVADADAVDDAAEAVERELGPIDVWVNCAAVTVLSPVQGLQPDEVRRVIEVSYLGYVHGTLAALRRMLPRDRGVIVQVGSAPGRGGLPLQSVDCAAKHAVAGFTASLRSELIHDRSGVRTTLVSLPAMNTSRLDQARSRLPYRVRPASPVLAPEVAARAIVRAASHPRRREVRVGRGRPAIRLTTTPEDPNRPDNLFAPIREDLGADGRYTRQARTTRGQRWAVVGLAALLLFAVGAGSTRVNTWV